MLKFREKVVASAPFGATDLVEYSLALSTNTYSGDKRTNRQNLVNSTKYVTFHSRLSGKVKKIAQKVINQIMLIIFSTC